MKLCSDNTPDSIDQAAWLKERQIRASLALVKLVLDMLADQH